MPVPMRSNRHRSAHDQAVHVHDSGTNQRQKRRTIGRLRAKLTRVGGQYRPICAATGGAVMPLGIEAIDRTLPGGGLPCGGLHELCGEMAASGFAAGLLGRFSAFGPVIWILPGHGLYAPGLEAFGLPWERLFVVTAQTRDARLWALEETLRTPGVAAALGDRKSVV